MTRDKSQRLFFMEMCIAAAYLILVAVACFMGFTKAKLMQMKANDTVSYMTMAENAAETFLLAKNKDDAEEIFCDYFDADCSDIITYDAGDDIHTVINITTQEHIMTAHITIQDNEKPVYQLTVTKALGERQ